MRVAAFLLVSGLLLGEFSTKTLKQVDWQTRCEAAEATVSEQAQTISEQAKDISALKAQLSALKQLLSGGAASF